jgi:hypothetical protein
VHSKSANPKKKLLLEAFAESTTDAQTTTDDGMRNSQRAAAIVGAAGFGSPEVFG